MRKTREIREAMLLRLYAFKWEKEEELQGPAKIRGHGRCSAAGYRAVVEKRTKRGVWIVLVGRRGADLEFAGVSWSLWDAKRHASTYLRECACKGEPSAFRYKSSPKGLVRRKQIKEDYWCE